MFVKQIDLQEALRLVRNGQEVKVLAPTGSEPQKWTDYCPDTLQNLLDGCLFFRSEPAMVLRSDFEHSLEPAPAEQPDNEKPKDTLRQAQPGRKANPIDVVKILALHKAGWSGKRIAIEMRLSPATISKYINAAKEEKGETEDA